MDKSRIEGCLIGAALGDALGAETEFLSITTILNRFGAAGPMEPPGDPAHVTDDTQMMIAVGETLAACARPFSPQQVGPKLAVALINWLHDPENNRAPGRTCLAACEALYNGKHWIDASQISSKGCGANMRVQPVGVLDVDQQTRATIAQFQAGFTHGHPTALAAADLTAWVIADLGRGGAVEGLAGRAREYAHSQREVYHGEWLAHLWERAPVRDSPEAYIARGWDECLGVLNRLDTALAHPDREADPCLATGAGWVAEEAFGTALLCFLLFPSDPVAAIRRGAVSSGDSDSIACLAGAFAGAYHGIGAWPADWVARIEYRERLLGICAALDAGNRAQNLAAN